MQKWIAFWMLGLIWGSSYLLIHIGVKELSPFQLVFMRTGIAAVGMNLVLFFYHKRLPVQWKRILPLLVIGIGNTTIPFVLISWGEQSVATGLASVIQSTEALFTLVIAHFAFSDERITSEKVLGLGISFIGVMILTSPTWTGESFQLESLLPILAIVLAQVFCASFSTYSRKVINSGVEPMIVSTGSISAAAITSGAGMLLAPQFGGQAPTPLTQVSANALLAVLILGLVNTLFAYLISYWAIQQLGVSRFSMVTYIILAVGLALGVIVLGETFDWRLVVGTGVVLAGIGLANLQVFTLQRRWLTKPVTTLAQRYVVYQTVRQVFAAVSIMPRKF